MQKRLRKNSMGKGENRKGHKRTTYFRNQALHVEQISFEETAAHGKQTVSEEKLQERVAKLQTWCQANN